VSVDDDANIIQMFAKFWSLRENDSIPNQSMVEWIREVVKVLGIARQFYFILEFLGVQSIPPWFTYQIW
jgi:hypothetical protein